jgi:hypothetical protein
MRKRWTGELPPLTIAELISAIQLNDLPQPVIEKLRELPAFAPYL